MNPFDLSWSRDHNMCRFSSCFRVLHSLCRDLRGTFPVTEHHTVDSVPLSLSGTNRRWPLHTLSRSVEVKEWRETYRYLLVFSWHSLNPWCSFKIVYSLKCFFRRLSLLADTNSDSDGLWRKRVDPRLTGCLGQDCGVGRVTSLSSLYPWTGIVSVSLWRRS